mgnify:CR=1 FL=1
MAKVDAFSRGDTLTDASPAAQLVSVELLRQLDESGPRYTSYPTADRFVEAFGPDTYRGWLCKRVLAGQPRPLSLYVHLPFCDSICYYCACNKVITRDHGRSAGHVRYVQRRWPWSRSLAAAAGRAAALGRRHADLSRPRRDDPAGDGDARIFRSCVANNTLSRSIRAGWTAGAIDLPGQLGFNRISIGDYSIRRCSRP